MGPKGIMGDQEDLFILHLFIYTCSQNFKQDLLKLSHEGRWYVLVATEGPSNSMKAYGFPSIVKSQLYFNRVLCISFMT